MDRCNKRNRSIAVISGAAFALLVLASRPLPAQTSQGLLLAGSVTGAPGATVSFPLTLVLNPGVSIDTFGVTLVLVPSGSAPAATSGRLSFAPAPGISSPTVSTADPGDVVMVWIGNLSATDPSHAVSGVVQLGSVTATIPGGAQNGQAYTVQIARAEADISGSNGSLTSVPLTPVSSAIGPVSTSLPLPPVIQPRGILNAASLSTRATISPGSISSLFGLNLAVAAQLGTAIPPSTTLGGTQLLFNGIPAPLFYVSPTQINFQMPVELPGTSAQVMVITNGVRSLTTTVQLAPQDPGIFALTATGSGQGAVLNPDYSVNSADNPAAAGSAIMIYATGLGPTNPPIGTGQPGGTSPPNQTAQTPTVLINGAPAQVLYSGLAPGFPGEYQVNAVIPPGTPAGAAVSLQIQIAGKSSNAVTIAVR